nr:hypothetical protein [Leptospira interrogans]
MNWIIEIIYWALGQFVILLRYVSYLLAFISVHNFIMESTKSSFYMPALLGVISFALSWLIEYIFNLIDPNSQTKEFEEK